MKYHTSLAMKKISDVINTYHHEQVRFYKVNWIIVSTSHDISKSHGKSGHRVRQKIRRRLWRIASKRYPCMRVYKIPWEIRGNTRCKIKLYYKIRRLLGKFIHK